MTQPEATVSATRKALAGTGSDEFRRLMALVVDDSLSQRKTL